jgi:hypothetical protein
MKKAEEWSENITTVELEICNPNQSQELTRTSSGD